MIDAGHISLGSKLPGERELSRMMKVSRPSLREALGVLSILGIIEHRPGSGTYLTSSAEGWPTEPFSILFLLKKKTLFEIFEARKILEGGIAGLAAVNRSEEDLDALKRELDSMRENLRSPEKYSRHEMGFHHAVIDAAGNTVIADLMENLYKLFKETRARIYRHFSARIKSYREQDYRNHERIFRAIQGGDANNATKAMVEHLLDFEKRLREEKNREELNRNG
ncbi:MAG: FadR family transcriptional regulator [Syntrophaceae bacterium]|nr:FadR family transcriptional regulator [Syntrophaceae bacterium]